MVVLSMDSRGGENGIPNPLYSLDEFEYRPIRRLNDSGKTALLDLKQEDLVFCHLDLALRNILVLSNSATGIIN